MNVVLSPCPYLPPPLPAMDWRSLRAHAGARGPAFYLTSLQYGHYLWRRGRAARALLCLDRAFGADLVEAGGNPVAADWPPPYRALAWMLVHAPRGVFLGNPRVHYQHLADRMNEPRREQRRWRAWACWAITRRVLPHLAGDPGQPVAEPTLALVARKLKAHGLPGEAVLWRRVLEACGPAAVHPKLQRSRGWRDGRDSNPRPSA